MSHVVDGHQTPRGNDVGVGMSARLTNGLPAHTRWNFTVLGADIAFFSLGLAISSAYTVMPLFIHHLTSNNVAVALIPALRALGLYGPPLFVAGFIERRRHAMPFILRATIPERVPYLLLAVGALWLAHDHPQLLVGVFLLMIFAASFGSGLTYAAWLDMVARAVPKEWLGRFFGFWTGLGGLAGIGGAAIAAAILARVAWPLNFALCFSLTFFTFIISFVLLALGREPAREQLAPQHDAVMPPLHRARIEGRAVLGLVRNDRGLQWLLLANALAGVATMASALFAVAALKRGGLNDAQVGAESTVLFIALTAGYFLWGAIGDRFGHRTVLWCSAACAALSAAIAIPAHGFWAYAAVFVLLGLNLSASSLAGLTFIAEFGPEARRPTYVALASVAYAPFAIGAPIIGGALADSWGYVPVFVVSVVAGAAAVLTVLSRVPDPRTRVHGEATAAKSVLLNQ